MADWYYQAFGSHTREQWIEFLIGCTLSMAGIGCSIAALVMLYVR